jgi:hypothetical protein
LITENDMILSAERMHTHLKKAMLRKTGTRVSKPVV